MVAGEIEFEWDDRNTEHLAAHKVTPTEFEQALKGDPLDLDCAFPASRPDQKSFLERRSR